MTDRELQLRFRAQLQRPASRLRCVSPEQLLAAAEPDADEALRLEVLGHVATCPDCRDEYEVARALLRAARPATTRRIWQPLAAAASVAVAVGLAVLWQLRPDAAPVVRGGETAPALYDIMPTPLSVQFAWQPTGTDHSYTLEILTESGDPVLSRTTADTVLLVPRNLLGTGRRTWSVASLAPDGLERRSKVQAITLP